MLFLFLATDHIRGIPVSAFPEFEDGNIRRLQKMLESSFSALTSALVLLVG